MHALPDIARRCGKIAANEKLIDHNELQVSLFLAEFSDC
jgi:hypothetical protein